MVIKALGKIAVVAAAVCAGSAANAGIIFSGSGAATALVSPNASCAPLPFQGQATGSGTSSFGAFSYSHTTCTAGATGNVFGTSTFDFGVDQFMATINGTAAATSTAGLFNLVLNYDITGGTGRFAGVTGSFNDIGTVDVRGGPPSRLVFAFSAVPEPGTWGMMLMGFGFVGFRLRRRSSAQSLQVG